jgi:hypothetical protein
MKKKLDTMFTRGLGNIIYTVEFMKNPSKCVERLGSRDEMLDRIDRAMEVKYIEE